MKQYQEKEEILLKENPNRFVMFPIQYQDMYDMYVTHRECFWNESEVDLSNDKKDWDKLNNDEKHFIKHVLAFFAASDGIVLENLALRFMSDVQVPEARAFYTFQMAMETVHSSTYSILLDTFITDASEKVKLFNAIDTIPSVKEKAGWAQRWINSNQPFATRLIAFACVEGIFFSGSFCCIYWLKERGVMPGLCESNDWISRDEGLHQDFAVLLSTKYVVNRVPEKEVHQIVEEAVAIESSFIIESIPCRLLGMNSDLMKEYIQFVANRLVLQLGYNALYPHSKNPFAFMDRICFNTKANFFERRSTQYRLSVEYASNSKELVFDAEF